MQPRKKKANRKLLLAVPIVWSVITVFQAGEAAVDGGQADAGADAGSTVDSRDHLCSVAPSGGAFGSALGAGCC